MIKEISGKKIGVIRQGRQETIEGTDSIVLFVRLFPENALIEDIKADVQEVYQISGAA
jgi:hypothetical protein